MRQVKMRYIADDSTRDFRVTGLSESICAILQTLGVNFTRDFRVAGVKQAGRPRMQCAADEFDKPWKLVFTQLLWSLQMAVYSFVFLF
jgi:hypothetical protein